VLVPLVGIPKESVKRVAKLSRFTLCKPEADVEKLSVIGSVVDPHEGLILPFSQPTAAAPSAGPVCGNVP
jgi:hypothetical protein